MRLNTSSHKYYNTVKPLYSIETTSSIISFKIEIM